MPQPAQAAPKSPHFFDRQEDGSVRLRIRFSAEEAAMYEEAAGSVPLLTWIHSSLNEAAHHDIESHRQTRPRVRPIQEP